MDFYQNPLRQIRRARGVYCLLLLCKQARQAFIVQAANVGHTKWKPGAPN